MNICDIKEGYSEQFQNQLQRVAHVINNLSINDTKAFSAVLKEDTTLITQIIRRKYGE